MAHKTISDFRQDVKSLLNLIYQEEQSNLAIHISDCRVQDLIEEYDENFSSIYINVAQQEVDKFQQS